MKTKMIFVGLLILLECSWSSAQQGERRFSRKEVLETLLDGYERSIRPDSASATGVRVQANLLIRSINRVDDTNMDFAVQMTFRQEWKDDRLAFNTNLTQPIEYLSLPDSDKIWKPDIFFQNEKVANFHNVMVPNQLVRIYPDGNILMSTRLSMVLGCPMDLRLFPMDRQICEIRFASYGHTNKDIDLVWKTSADPEYSPVQVAASLSMPRFTLAGRRVGECTSQTSTGTYSCLKVALFLQRGVSHYVMQYYLPTMMLVIVSWIPFWLDPEALTARFLLGILTLLAVAGFNVWVSYQMPPLSYSTSIGVWGGCCMALIFLTLLVHAAVNFLNKKNRDRQRRMADPNGFAAKPLLGERAVEDERYTPSTLADKLDFFSRIVFPALFLLFNILYWSISFGSVPNWPSAD